MTDRPSETRVSAAHVAISEFTGASQKAREFVAMLDAVLPLMPPRPMSDAGWALLETLAASVAGYSGPIRKALDAAHASRAERQPTTPSGNARWEDHGGPIVRADPDRRQSPTESEVMPNSTRSGHVGSKDTTKPPSMAAGAVDPKTWDGGERREKQRRVKAMAGEHLPARRVGEDRRQPPPPDWKQDAAETSRVMPAKSPAPPKAGSTAGAGGAQAMTTITEARLTAEQLDELRKVAEAATPGPWTEKEIGWWQNDILAPDGHAVVKAATRPAGASNANGGVARVKDRTHIASFDPPTALALLDRIAVLTEALQYYAKTFCEGVENGCGHLHENVCSGCSAYAALSALPRPDNRKPGRERRKEDQGHFPLSDGGRRGPPNQGPNRRLTQRRKA